ncbi:Ig-like domain-containing protein [Chitinophaga horti]|uniref:Ig-like domain-containing protein n=1 Tax=Chitinophaga horti TaxID=2920382 RepID=A0ABY6IZB2_9BACT|nr:Ig-like domain-containing protein [Chitinophaga horti]UYQ92620.1 Ig-like domain-containing protein [Chitinophaga horti]
MRKFLLLIIILVACSQVFAQAELTERVPAATSDYNTNRGPNGTTDHRSFRGVMILTAAELANIPANTPLTRASFFYRNGANVAANGTLKFYLQNTTDATNQKTSTWTDVINGMSEAYSGAYTIPAGTATEAFFQFGTPFQYNGGGLYVAYEYVGSTFASSPAAYQVNNSLNSSLKNEASNTTTPPAILTSTTNIRPQLIFAYQNPYTNEASIASLRLNRSIENKFMYPGNGIRVEVQNRGSQDRTAVPVTITVTGANPYSETQAIPLLQAGQSVVLNFNALPTNVSGTQTITATLPGDDNNANNSKSVTQQVDCSRMRYYEELTTPSPIGYGAGNGTVALKFVAPPVTPVLVKGLNLRLSSHASAPGTTLYGVLIDKDGVELDRTDPVTLASSDLGTVKSFEFLAPTQLPAGEEFYLGIAQEVTGSGILPLSAYATVNVQYQPFYTIHPSGAPIIPVTTLTVTPGIEAIVDGLPVTLAASATEVCAGTPVTFTATSGFAYPAFQFTSGATVLQSTAANALSYAPASDVQVVVGGLYNGCPVVSNPVDVTVKPAPVVAAITGDATVCGNATTQLANATPGGVWSSSDINIATVDAGGLVTGVAGGAVVISYNVTANGCTTVATHQLNVNTPGVISPTTGTSDICVGASTTLANPTPGGTWSSSDINVATVTNGVVTSVAAGTATIVYAVADASGCSGTANFDITVHALPAVPVITGSTAVCENEQITLASVTTGGVWSVNDAAVATIHASTGVVNGIADGNAVITYAITDGAGCSNAGTYNITVNPAATVAAITGANSMCVNSNVILSNATTGGAWSSSDEAIAEVNATTGEVTGIAAGAATITYTVSNANGCTASATYVVTVNALPALLPISGSNTLCIGTSATLTNATAGGAWTTSDPAIVNVNATTGEISGIAAGVSTITYNITNANGCVGSRTLDVEVAASVTVPAFTGGRGVCEGSTLDLDNTRTGGVWSTDNAAIADVDASTGVVTGISAGIANITYTLTVATGCSGSYSDAVQVNAKPAAPVVTGATEVCEGGSITLNGSGTGSWSSANTAIATVDAATGIVTGISAGTTAIIYNIVSADGCGNSTAYNVTVKGKPAPGTISGGNSVCVNNTLNLTSSVSGGVWSTGNGGFAGIDAATGVVTGLASGAETITYTVTSAGCTNSTSTTVTVNANPIVPAITGTTTVCSGASTILANSLAGGVWSSGNTAVAQVSNGVVSGISAGTAVITYTVTNASGCTASQQITVTVNALPAAGTISGGSNVCVNGSLNLTSSVSGGSWLSDNTSIATINNGLLTGVAEGSVNIVYTVTSNGCTGTSQLPVSVRAVPVLSGIVGTNILCTGGTATLTNSTAGGTWTVDQPGIVTVSATGVVTGISAGDAVITYTFTNANNCAASVTHPLRVNAAPAAITFAGGDKVCIGSAIQLTPSVAGGTWTTSDAAIANVANGLVTGVTAGTATISYAVATTGGCTATGTQTVTVSALPTAGTIGGAGNVCVGGETQLTASVTGGIWSSGNINTAYVNTLGMVSGVAAGTATIRYTVANAAGCSNTAEFAMTVNSAVNAGAITGGDNVCIGSSIQLANATAGGVWSSANNAIATISNSGLVTGMAAGTVQITYTLTGTGGCTASVAHQVTVNALPSVTITSADSVCIADGKVTLTANVVGGAWSGEGTFTGNEWNFANLGVGTTVITYTYTNDKGCVATTTKTIRRVDCRVIDTRPGVLLSFDLMPNPATNYIKMKVAVESGAGTWTVQVTDLSGKRRMTYLTELIIGANEKVLDISSLPSGIYFLTLRHGDKSKTVSFMKAK